MKLCLIFLLFISTSLYSLDILPKQVVMHPGAKLQFCVLHSESGAVHTPRNLKWSVSEGYISSNGEYTAPHNVGKYYITVQSNNLTSKAIVYVKLEGADYLTSIEMESPEKVFAGQEIQMKAIGYNQKKQPTNFKAIWQSRGGIISQDGKIKVLSEGKVDVLVKDANSPLSATTSFTVYENKIKKIEVLPKKATVSLGDKMRFFAIAYDKNGKETFFEPKWSVIGSGTIEANGEFTTGSYTGNTKVTVYDPMSGQKAFADITVSSASSTSEGKIEIGAFFQHNNVLKIAYQVFGHNIHRTSLFAIEKNGSLKLLDSCTCFNGSNITFEKSYPYESKGFEIQIFDNYNRPLGSIRRNFSNE